jgi:predicted pyridoxine 5'-phosphate oxidase superfamily flavin-nucleotide-binding protein
MSKLFGETHKALQQEHNTEVLADTLEAVIVHDEVSEDDKAFIQSRDMFFLSSVDSKGQPTVSYKGGDRGFVQVLDSKTLAFPSYDGNGMFLSMGNIAASRLVGMLFIDFENPYRLRVQGEARLEKDHPLMDHYKEAEMIVCVTVSEIFQNCPRYIHRYEKVEQSSYVPKENIETPLPNWKKLDLFQENLSPQDRDRLERQGGTITIEELQALEQRND